MKNKILTAKRNTVEYTLGSCRTDAKPTQTREILTLSKRGIKKKPVNTANLILIIKALLKKKDKISKNSGKKVLHID